MNSSSGRNRDEIEDLEFLRELSPVSTDWVYSKKTSLFVLLPWKTARLPTYGEKRRTNYPQRRKASILSAPPSHSGALVPEYSLSGGISHMCLGKRTGAAFFLTVHEGLPEYQKLEVSA